MTRSKIYDFGKSELQRVVDESNSYADVLRKLELNPHGGNRKTLNKVIEKLNIDTSKLEKQREKTRVIKKEIPLEEILSEDYNKEYNSNKLKMRLIKAGLKDWKCENCGLTEWLGDPIPLELHHIDGDRTNNVLDNLQLLCPNCHSLTDNFAGRKLRKKPFRNRSKPIQKHDVGWDEEHRYYYDEKGKKKELCPVCKKNLKTISAYSCKSCANKLKPHKVKEPLISKETLEQLLDTYKYFTEVGKITGHDRKTIKKWFDYYNQ